LLINFDFVNRAEIKSFLDKKVKLYNHRDFIKNDPISIPHDFSKRQDIEIAGLFAAMLAWGQRTTIIKKCRELMERMDNAPHAFVLHHNENDLKQLTGFKHRTFNDTDLLYFVSFLHWYYGRNASLEDAFPSSDGYLDSALVSFHNLFFSLEDHPHRTRKHIPTPERKSTCKRLCMYLRWMVRQDDNGVDFGLWKKISPSMLICPCDVHVDRVARKLKLIRSRQTNWQTALELTNNLRKLDPADPVKYDFALFGLGVMEGWA
jgi:uncharacterized protein (TIGR02757 family)